MTYRDLADVMLTVNSNFATNPIIEHLGAKNIQKTRDALGATGMHVLRGVEDDKAFHPARRGDRLERISIPCST